jgi:hypothetical protein
MAGAQAIRGLAESLCPGIFEQHDLAENDPAQKETILGLVAAYEMQAALALENALKGLQVAIDSRENRSIIGEEGQYAGKLAKRYRSHRAVDLAEACEIALTPILRDLLTHTTSTVEWGKYGMALEPDAHWFDGCDPYDEHAVCLQFLEDVRCWHDEIARGTMKPRAPKTPRDFAGVVLNFEDLSDELSKVAGPGFHIRINMGAVPAGYSAYAHAVHKETGEVKEILFAYKGKTTVTVLTGERAVDIAESFKNRR